MTQTTLQEASEFITDGTHGSPKRTGDANGIPLLSAKNVFDGEVRWDDFDRVPLSELEEFQKRVHLKEGDVLMTCVGTIGRAAVWLNERPVVFFRSVAIIRPKPSLLPKYLEYVIRSAGFQHELRRRTKRSSQGGIYLKDIKIMPLVVPLLAEQERIVKLLDEADELRKLRANADRRTTDLVPALFHEMFGENDQFRPVPVGELTSLVTSGSTPRGGEDVYVSEGSYFIRSQNVQMNRLDFSDVACLPAEIHEQMARTKVARGDVLLNITGASIGRVAWVGELDHTANVSQHVCLIRPNADLLNSVYLSVFISLPTTQRLILQVQAGASRQALNHQQVRALEIPLPPLSLQNEFARRVTEIRELETAQAASRHRLEDLFQSLLHRAFQGEL